MMIRLALKKYIHALWFNRLTGISRILWPALCSLWLSAHGFPDFMQALLFCLFVVATYGVVYVSEDMAIARGSVVSKRLLHTPLFENQVTLKDSQWLFWSIVLLLGIVSFFKSILLGIFVGAGCLAALSYQWLPSFKRKAKLFTGLLLLWVVFVPYVIHSSNIPVMTYFLSIVVLLWWSIDEIIYHLVKNHKQILLPLALLQLLMVGLLTILGIFAGLGAIYFIGLLLIIALYFYQHRILKQQLQDQFEKIRVYNRYIGLVVFIGIFLSYL